jgi:hypothetical protein
VNFRDAYAKLRVRYQRRQGSVTYIAKLLGGMIGTKVTKGEPKDYAAALDRAGIPLPSTLTNDQHSILAPLSQYFQYQDKRHYDPPAKPGEDR